VIGHGPTTYDAWLINVFVVERCSISLKSRGAFLVGVYPTIYDDLKMFLCDANPMDVGIECFMVLPLRNDLWVYKFGRAKLEFNPRDTFEGITWYYTKGSRGYPDDCDLWYLKEVSRRL
jgi:hypothetical protein